MAKRVGGGNSDSFLPLKITFKGISRCQCNREGKPAQVSFQGGAQVAKVIGAPVTVCAAGAEMQYEI